MPLSEDTLFQGFSCPTEAFHESSLHLVAVQYARVVLEVFVGSFEAELKPYVRSTIAPFMACRNRRRSLQRTAGKFNNEDYRDPHRT